MLPKSFFLFISLFTDILTLTGTYENGEQKWSKREKHISHLLGPFLHFAKFRKDVCRAGS